MDEVESVYLLNNQKMQPIKINKLVRYMEDQKGEYVSWRWFDIVSNRWLSMRSPSYVTEDDKVIQDLWFCFDFREPLHGSEQQTRVVRDWEYVK